MTQPTSTRLCSAPRSAPQDSERQSPEPQGIQDDLSAVTRRQFFDTGRLCLGPAALSMLAGGLSQSGVRADSALSSRAATNPGPHFPPRVKRVIFLYMSGDHRSLKLLISNLSCKEWTGSRCRSPTRRGSRSRSCRGRNCVVLDLSPDFVPAVSAAS